MQQTDYELISAYLDDELDPQGRAKVEEKLMNDNEFAQVFATFDQQNAHIKQTFAAIDDKPVPDALQALLTPEEPSAEVQSNVVRPQVSAWKRWMPLAASVAIAAVISPIIFQQQGDGKMTLAQALETVQSGEILPLDGDEKLYFSMSFENNQGDWCREYFLASGTAEKHIVACQEASSWRTMIEVDAPFPDPNVYSPASGGSEAVDAWLDDNMASDSLSKEQEAARLKRLNP